MPLASAGAASAYLLSLYNDRKTAKPKRGKPVEAGDVKVICTPQK
jgi:hypothetical protein